MPVTSGFLFLLLPWLLCWCSVPEQSMAPPTPKHRPFLIPQLNRLSIKQNNRLGKQEASSYEWNSYLFSCSFPFPLLQNPRQTVEFAP